MRRLIGLFIFIFFSGSAYTQNISQDDIPAVVLNGFQLKYPNASDVTWKLNKGNYQISYKVNAKANKLLLDYRGSVIEHSQDLYTSEIPRAVLNTIRTKVNHFDIQDADKQEKNGKTTYIIQFKIDGKNYYFWIEENGALTKYRKELKDNQIPGSIKNAIQNQYGKIDVKRAKYVEENGNINYIIGGDIENVEHVFWFDTRSRLLKHTQDFTKAELPNSIQNTLAANYKDYEVRDADLVEERGSMIYILRIRKSKDQLYVTFNREGNVLAVK